MAVDRLREAYGFSELQAEAVLDCQLRLLTGACRSELGAERDLLRQIAAEDGDVIDVAARALSGTHLVMAFEGTEYDCRGRDRERTIGRLVDVVRDQIARPRLADVRVSIERPGSGGGPSRVLVDPLGNARFSYPDDEE